MATILVIDDEAGIRGLLCTLLEQKGYEVRLAEDGSKGLALFRRERPELVILDLKMPGLDGVTVLQELRNLDRSVPVVVFTGAGTDDMHTKLQRLGAATVIAKEFSLHRLGDILKRLVPSAGTGNGAPGRRPRAHHLNVPPFSM